MNQRLNQSHRNDDLRHHLGDQCRRDMTPRGDKSRAVADVYVHSMTDEVKAHEAQRFRPGYDSDDDDDGFYR